MKIGKIYQDTQGDWFFHGYLNEKDFLKHHRLADKELINKAPTMLKYMFEFFDYED
ncbi:MAG: hypothetical protein GY775_08290 [Candidatus Scalindua sp.]|nr:hypothetical protein [Candidatus Scalindua sp.]